MPNTTAAKIEWKGKELLEGLREDQEDVMYEVGEIVLEEALNKVRPMRFTGRLEESGYVSTASKSTYVKRYGYKKERKPVKAFEVIIAFSAKHSHLVEFGTVKMAARPYIRPALDHLANKLGGLIAIKLTKSLAKKLKKSAK